MNIKYLICFVSCLLTVSCAKENITPIINLPTVNTIGDNPTIYIAGETNFSSVVWKNGSADTLAHQAVGQSVFVDGNDTYVAGWTSSTSRKQTAMYWKNGSPLPLRDNNNDTYAKSIVVSGKAVYVVGFEFGNGPLARCWKNGIPMPLDLQGTITSVAVSSFVSGSDIYVAGWVFNLNGQTVAVYWKNGKRIPLTDGTSDCMAEDIFVSGDDVYVAGTINYPFSRSLPTEIFVSGPQGIATYWKNGEPITLSTNGRAQSIFVNGTDVYVSGSICSTIDAGPTPFGPTSSNLAVYWKNGIPVNLVNDTSSDASSISVTKNGDVYTAGWIDHQAVYWINETATHLPVPYRGQGFLYSIFLTN